MADFKVIYRNEHPAWQPGCPILVETIQVARNTTTAQCFLQLKLKNISASPLSAVFLQGIVTTPYGVLESLTYENLDADIQPGREMLPPGILLNSTEVSDVSIWVTRAGNVTSFASLEPQPTLRLMDTDLLSKEVQEFRSQAILQNGANPARLRFETYDGGSWWQCACGALNANRERCCACGTSKTFALQISSAQVLTEAEHASALEEANKLCASPNPKKLAEGIAILERLGDFSDAAARLEDAKSRLKATKRKTKTSILVASIAIAVIAVAALLTFVVIPAIQNKIGYDTAVELYEAGDYAGAADAFAALGDYSDAQARAEEAAMEATYQKAMSLYEAGDFETATKLFSSLGSYKDSETMAARSQAAADDAAFGPGYEKAMEYLAAGEWEKAYREFSKLGTYKDSAQQAAYAKAEWDNGSSYATAEALLKAGRSGEAYLAFCGLGSYHDAEQRAKAILRELKVGDIILMGTYEQDNNTADGAEYIEWIVLANDGDNVVLISKHCLDCRKFNKSGNSWTSSDLRNWLENTFLYNAGLQDILGGISLLSVDEARRYFSSDNARRASATAYAIAQGAWQSTRNGCSDWWLRSPGNSSQYGTNVNQDGVIQTGDITVYDPETTVRPALWLSIREDIEAEDKTPTERTTFPNLAVGEELMLGSFEQDNNTTNGTEGITWQVLAIEGNTALVISKSGLDAVAYTDLLSWLESFRQTAFSAAERDSIQQISCLSTGEFEKYFDYGGDGRPICAATAFADARGVETAKETVASGYMPSDSLKGISDASCCWWLRSGSDWNDDGRSEASYVCWWEGGYPPDHGTSVHDTTIAVRPTMWIKL